MSNVFVIPNLVCASSRSIVITTLFSSVFVMTFIMICGTRISSVICVHSRQQNKLFFHLRYSFKSVDFKIGTFTSFILTLVVSLVFCFLVPSFLSSNALSRGFNFSSSNPVSSILLLLVPTSMFPTDHCGSHLNCVVVSPVGVHSFSPLICFFFRFKCLCHSSKPQPSTCQSLLSIFIFFLRSYSPAIMLKCSPLSNSQMDLNWLIFVMVSHSFVQFQISYVTSQTS